jgi:hypothetical protein
VHVGEISGWVESITGYRHICIDGCTYKAHRLAYLYMTGEWPKDQIDHINMDKNDNRWGNLRAATRSQNMANTRARTDNISGFKGVVWMKRQHEWAARIGVNGKQIHLGYFDKPHVAYAAVCVASRKHFGDFARVYEADQLIIPRRVFEERVLRNLLIATQPDYARAA